MDFNYLPTGSVKTYINKLAKSSMFSLEQWLKKALSYLNVTVADPCCPTDVSPTRYNEQTQSVENFNQTTQSWEPANLSDYLPLSGGTMQDNAVISWKNEQYIGEGSSDLDLDSIKGISLFSTGYELNWQGGVLANYKGVNNIQNIKLGSHLQFDANGTLRGSNGTYSVSVDERYLHDSDENTVVSWGVPNSYRITLLEGASITDIGDYGNTGDYSRLEQNSSGLRFTGSSGVEGSNLGVAKFLCRPSEFNCVVRDVDNAFFNNCELSPTSFKIQNQLGYWISSYNSDTHQSIIIGDEAGNQNGTYLEIDDANAKIKFSQNINIPNGVAPVSSTAPGTEGDVIFTEDAIYRCVATNSWKRIEFSHF